MSRRLMACLVTIFLLLLSVHCLLAQDDAPPEPPTGVSDNASGDSGNDPIVRGGLIIMPDQSGNTNPDSSDQGYNDGTDNPTDNGNDAQSGGPSIEGDIEPINPETVAPPTGDENPNPSQEEGTAVQSGGYSRSSVTKSFEPASDEGSPDPLGLYEAASSKQTNAWPMFRRDAFHTGYVNQKFNFPLKVGWKYIANPANYDPLADNPSSPAVADGFIYFCAGTRLYVLDADTGALMWRYPTDRQLEGVIKASPLVGPDLVYFGCGDGNFYAIRKQDGRLAWSFASGSAINSSAVLADGIIYVGSTDNCLYALDAKTGTPKWPGGFKTRDDVSTTPVVSKGVVYFVSDDLTMYAALASTGQMKWSTRVGGVTKASTPILDGNTIYLAAGNILQAFNAVNGQLKWGVRTPDEITTVPALGNGVLYFACADGKMYAVSTEGKGKWKAAVDLGGRSFGSPVVLNDTVLIGGTKGLLLAADCATGSVKWKYYIQPSTLNRGKLQFVNISAPLVVADKTVFALADDGTLYSFSDSMPDATAPDVPIVVPARGTVISGRPPVKIAAMIRDDESGVNPATVALELDGNLLDFTYKPDLGILYYKTPIEKVVLPLSDGQHTISLTAADWSGNKTKMQWSFTVDNRIVPTTENENNTNRNNPRGGQRGGMGAPGGVRGGMGGRPGM